MPELTASQINDLRSLKTRCEELGADLVVIGAIAYQVHFPDEARHTADVDFAVALDLDDFAKLEQRLVRDGWTRTPNREHRWRSAQATLLDLVPAGPHLREAKKITWPESQMTMSLVGFNHVFERAEPHDFGSGLTLRVIPAVVLMLLKIVAFMDDQSRRAKDLADIRSLIRRYEENSDRLFSEPVLDANLADIRLAPAFLLGTDLRRLCTADEDQLVEQFLEAMDETKPAWMGFVRAAGIGDEPETEARAELESLKLGFRNRAPQRD